MRAGVVAVLGGHGLATVAYAGLVKDQVAAGNMRVIGVMADKRIAQLPDVKTLKEQGIDVPTELDAMARRGRSEEHARRRQEQARQSHRRR